MYYIPIKFPNEKAKNVWAQFLEQRQIWKSMHDSENAAIQCGNRKMWESIRDAEDQAWHRMYWAYKEYCNSIGRKNYSMEFLGD